MAGRFDNIFSGTQAPIAPATATASKGRFSNVFSSEPDNFGGGAPAALPAAPKAVQALPGTMQSLSELQTDPLNLKGAVTPDATVKAAIETGWNTIKDAFGNLASSAAQVVANGQDPSRMNSTKSLSDIAGLFNASANVVFSPITAIFGAASKLPVVGTVAKLISLPFTAAGEGSKDASNALIDKLPITQQAKDQLKPAVGDMAALAAQIAVGGVSDVVGEKVLPSERAASAFRDTIIKENPTIAEDVKKVPTNKVNDLVTKYGPEDAKTIIMQAVEIARQKRGMPASVSAVTPDSQETYQQTPVTPKFNNVFEQQGQPAEAPAAPVIGAEAPKSDLQTIVDEQQGGLPAPQFEKPQGTVINVNGQQHELLGSAQDRFLREQTRSQQNVDLTRRMSPASAESTARGEAMKMSALKRDLTGQYTSKELMDRMNQERGNYDGKRIVTDINGQNVEGTVKGKPAYGKFKVKLDDGTTVTRTADRMSDIRTNTEIIDKITKRTNARPYVPKEVDVTKKVTPESVAEKAGVQFKDNYAATKDEYTKRFGNAVSADNAKELVHDYAPSGVNVRDETSAGSRANYSDVIQKSASQFANQIYDDKIEENKGKGNETVLMTGGGTGAGKSTFIENNEALAHYPVAYDGNMDNVPTAERRIDKALENGYNVEIKFIFRDAEEAYRNGVLQRGEREGGRTPTTEGHADTHIGSLKAIQEIAKDYGSGGAKENNRVKIDIYQNIPGKGQVPMTLDELSKIEYNESNLRENLKTITHEEHAKGNISDRTKQAALRARTEGVSRASAADKPSGNRSNSESGKTVETAGRNGETEKPIKPVEGNGPATTLGLSKGIEAKAIENKLTQGFGDLPAAKTLNMADQAKKVLDFMADNPDEARKIAMGESPAPKGITPEAFLVAVEDKAIREGDVATLRELAQNSGLNIEARTMGQRIRTLAERDPDSPVTAMQDIQDARMEALKSRLKAKDLTKATDDVVKNIKSSIRKAAPTRQTVEDFIKGIQC